MNAYRWFERALLAVSIVALGVCFVVALMAAVR